jgi:4-hydroxybenzoate polyprenyltransferase/phosphoserine phosphatase
MTLQPKILFVDLDGTLIKTDMLLESFLFQAKEQPTQLLRSALALAKGKAQFKAKLAEGFEFSPENLPYCPEVLEYVRTRRAEGAKVVLATASNSGIAQQISAHLDCFDAVLASDEHNNLKSERKLLAMRQYANGAPFEYIGNSADDLPVWEAAATAKCAHPDRAAKGWFGTRLQEGDLTRSAEQVGGVTTFVKAARLHQWLKNVLVFVPLLASHKVLDLPSLMQSIVAFIAFGLCASAIYLVNDLLDLESDRAHPRKRSRPFAAGSLSLLTGIAATPGLLLLSLVLSLVFLPPLFTLCLGGYLALTLAYSFSLKKKMAVDVIVLASLYTSRILAGAAAISTAPSFWLLAFSMFIFLGLALVKRYAELNILLLANKEKVSGRNYLVSDMSVVMTLGTASGMMSILVLALYINSPEVKLLYPNPVALWAICPILLYWITRIWMVTQRGGMHDDPVVYAMKDNVSRLTFVVAAIAVIAGSIRI